jgi:hypothetical protein
LEEERLRFEAEKADIDEQIEISIQELVKTKSETARKTIEKSIENLETERQEANEKTAYVNRVISNIENQVKNVDLFGEYRKHILDVMAMVGKSAGKSGENGTESVKAAVKSLVSVLILQDSAIKIALSGVNHSGPRSSVFAPSPPLGLEPRTYWLTANRSTS